MEALQLAGVARAGGAETEPASSLTDLRGREGPTGRRDMASGHTAAIVYFSLVPILLLVFCPMSVNFAACLLLMYVNTEFVLMMIVILAAELILCLLLLPKRPHHMTWSYQHARVRVTLSSPLRSRANVLQWSRAQRSCALLDCTKQITAMMSAFCLVSSVPCQSQELCCQSRLLPRVQLRGRAFIVTSEQSVNLQF